MADGGAAPAVDVDGGPAGGGGPGSTPSGGDAGADGASACSGVLPPLVPGSDPGEEDDRCAGSIAERVFGHALCTCEDLSVQGYLRTRSWDSSLPGMPADAEGAAVGVNERYTSGSYTDVGGSLTLAGPGPVLRFAGALDVHGDARIASSVESAGYVSIARDARIGGDVSLAGLLSVGRDLYQPIGAALRAVPIVGGMRRSEDVRVPPPCECPSSPIVDVRGAVTGAQDANDDASIGLDPDALSNVIGAVRLELPCGRYYVRDIGGIGLVTLAVEGHVALFVDGDLRSIGALEADLAPGAELDIFVSGTIEGVGWGRFGGGDRPAAVRIYVGGDQDIVLTGADVITGNLYAPRAKVVLAGAAFVSGALFAREVEARGALTVEYDRAVTRVGDDCPEEPPPPGGCDVCDGTCDLGACVDSACGPCGSDADCCAPLVCVAGRCEPLLF